METTAVGDKVVLQVVWNRRRQRRPRATCSSQGSRQISNCVKCSCSSSSSTAVAVAVVACTTAVTLPGWAIRRRRQLRVQDRQQQPPPPIQAGALKPPRHRRHHIQGMLQRLRALRTRNRSTGRISAQSVTLRTRRSGGEKSMARPYAMLAASRVYGDRTQLRADLHRHRSTRRASRAPANRAKYTTALLGCLP